MTVPRQQSMTVSWTEKFEAPRICHCGNSHRRRNWHSGEWTPVYLGGLQQPHKEVEQSETPTKNTETLQKNGRARDIRYQTAMGPDVR